MASRITWIIVAFSFVAAIQSAAALRCWSCTSDRSPECGDPMNITEHQMNFHTRDCEASGTPNMYNIPDRSICKKMVTRENGRLIVRRSCEIPTQEEKDIMNGPCPANNAVQSHVVVESCQVCSKDLCNSATTITGAQVFHFAAIVFVASHLLSGIRSFSF